MNKSRETKLNLKDKKPDNLRCQTGQIKIIHRKSNKIYSTISRINMSGNNSQTNLTKFIVSKRTIECWTQSQKCVMRTMRMNWRKHLRNSHNQSGECQRVSLSNRQQKLKFGARKSLCLGLRSTNRESLN